MSARPSHVRARSAVVVTSMLATFTASLTPAAHAAGGETFVAPYTSANTRQDGDHPGTYCFVDETVAPQRCSIHSTADATTGALTSTMVVRESEPLDTLRGEEYNPPGCCRTHASGTVVLAYELERRVRQLTVTAQVYVNHATAARLGNNTEPGAAGAALQLYAESATCAPVYCALAGIAAGGPLVYVENNGDSAEIRGALYELTVTVKSMYSWWIEPGVINVMPSVYSWLDNPRGLDDELSASIDVVVRSITVK